MKLFENLSINSLDDYLSNPEEWDLFLSAGSFEDRCLKSANIFRKYKVKIGNSIIFNYKENDPKDRKANNVSKMEKILKKFSGKTFIFNAESVSLPSEGIKKFLIFLKKEHIEISNNTKIIIDLTTFTKPYFFLLIKILKEIFNCSQFHVVYSEPGDYTKNDSKTTFVFTEGLDRIEPIPGFTGSSKESKDALIISLGFEENRVMEVFIDVNPDLTFAINGFPSFQPGWDKISLERNMRFLSESGANNRLLFAPSIDPFETKKRIEDIALGITKIDENFNIIISPLGSKMQALGILLFALENPNVKIVYPFPSSYSPACSTNCGPSWIALVHFK